VLFVSVLGVPSVHSVGTFFLQQIWNSTWEVVYRPFLPCHLLRFYEAAAFFLERYPQKTFVRDSECSNPGLLEVQYPPGVTWWPLKQKLPLMAQLCYAEVFSNCPSSEILVVCIDFFCSWARTRSQIRSFSVKYWDPSNFQPKGGGRLLSVHQGY
jgi:hypothetical protein